MLSQNNNNLSEKKSETKARVAEIAETLLSLLPKGKESNLDSIENALTHSQCYQKTGNRAIF